MIQLSLTLFGGFTAVIQDGQSLHFPTDKARALLAYLVLAADIPLRREALAGLFWPEQPEVMARQNLRQTLSRLRKSLNQEQDGLGDALLTVTRQTVELHGQYGLADAAQFRENIAAVQAHPHNALAECPACLVRLEAAATLYRQGDFLAGLSLPDAPPFEEWLLLRRERFYQRQLMILSQLTDAYEQKGASQAACRYALWQIEIEPWREEAHRQLMRLQAGMGQRGQALAQYESCRQILAEEIGLEPAAETQQLWQQIKAGAFQPAVTSRAKIYHFPSQPTPFVGRTSELVKIFARLNDKTCRVLSLVGPGGMGKTRLSVQVGRELSHGETVSENDLPYYANGAYFIPLAEAHDAELLVTAVAQGLGLQLVEHIPPRQQLLNYLQDKELLLVCDSFEHVMGGEGLIAEIVMAAPQVQLLVTSQQPLNIEAEQRLAIGGLDYAVGDAAAEAVQLFLRSARRAVPDFQLADADIPVLLALCRLLDGMPLALEIAAAWTRMMDCATILQETQKNLNFLASPLGDKPARHQSVAAVLTRSWQLLPTHLQQSLQQMAHFAGGFTLEAARVIMPETAINDMAALLDKSLISWQPDGRYQMHQLLRHFVRQQPQQDSEASFRQRYCRYYFGFVADQEAELRRQNPQQALAAIQRDIDNIRQAWQWALDGQMTDILAGLDSLGHFYHLVGLFEEAEQQLLAALSLAATWEPSPATAVAQAKLHAQLSHFLGQSGHYQKAIEQAHSVQKLAEQLNRTDLLAQALRLEGEWRRHLSQLDEAKRCLEAAAALYATPDRSGGYAHTLNQIGQIHLIQSQYEAALAAFNQARQIYALLGDQTELSTSLGHIAEVYRLKADYPQALAHCRQALDVAETIGYKQAVVKNGIVLGNIHLEQSDFALARATYENALQLAKEIGYLQGIINCHIFLGAAYVTQGRLDEAEQWLRAARLQAEEAGLQDLIALTLGRQGVIHAHRGQHEAAIIAYQQAAQLWRLLDNQMEFSRNLANLGNVYLRLGDYERARSYFEEALTGVQAIGARQAVANLMIRLGNVYKRTGNYERAIACFEQSLALHRALQHKSGMASSLGWLGVMYNEMGRYAEAQAHYEQAMPLSQEAGDHLSLAVWMMNRAEAVMRLGQRELAESLSQQAVDHCRSLGNTRFLPGTITQQAEIQFAHGKYEQSRLALAEALPLAAAVGDQKMNFDARLLQARLLDRFGQRATAVAQLRSMITEFTADDYQAQLYYYLWEIEGDAAARQKAIPLYETVLAQAPNYLWRQQLKELVGGSS